VAEKEDGGMTEINARGDIFLSLLAVLLIGLKLTGHIDWSWWWVLSPIWMPLAIFLIVLAIWLARKKT
jgi:hypothetical protein